MLKTEPPPGSRLGNRSLLLVGVAAVAGILSLASREVGALSSLERQSVDARFLLRGVKPPADRVVIVALDDKSVRAFNKLPPIPRGNYAQLLDRLGKADPALVMLDHQFAGEGESPSEDEALLAAIERNAPVLVSAPGPDFVPAGVRTSPGAELGWGGVENDRDGVVRRMMYGRMYLRGGSRHTDIKTLAVRAAELVQNRRISAQDFPENSAWIDFRGPPGTFRTYPLIDVLRGEVPDADFHERVVIVGTTAPAAKDVFVTAASANPMAGVEIHANALTTILNDYPLKPAKSPVNVILILVLAALPPLFTTRFSSLHVLIGALATLGLFVVGVQIAFNVGWIVSISDAILGLVLATTGAIAVESFIARRQNQALEAALEGLLRPGNAAFFISYRRDQAAFAANSLRAELAHRFGDSKVFMDTSSIGAGREFPREIQEAILGCSVMLVLVGPYWLSAKDSSKDRRLDDPADWVRLEIEAGLRRPEVAVVPILLDGARVPDEQELPDSLRPLTHRNAVSLTGERLSFEIDDLVKSIQSGSIQDLFRES